MTDVVLQKLRDGFLMDYSDEEACLYAGISARTLYNYQEANPDFLQEKQLLKSNVRMKAKTNVAKSVDAGDEKMSMWYLERRDQDFKPKQTTDLNTTVSFTDLFYSSDAGSDHDGDA